MAGRSRRLRVRDDGRERPTHGWLPGATAGLCAVVGLSRLPFLTAPVSADEGGFLVVGAQWRAGSSLYGGYWVDRPPLLVAVFACAHLLGGPVALRTIGLLAAVAAVAAAALVGWLGSVRRRAAAVACAVTAAAFLVTPLFGTRIVDGELLAAPLVLGGLAALLAADRPPYDRRAATLRALAGGLGAGAFLVKQDMVDVLVVAAVLVGHALVRRGPRRALRVGLPVLAGAVVTTAAVTALAATRGTPVSGLWAAVVAFRFEAAPLLGFSAARLTALLRAYAVSGALLVTAVAAGAVLGGHRTARAAGDVLAAPAPLGTAAVVLSTWELVGVLAGGSYWSHYLVGLVPGLVLLVAAAHRNPRPTARRLVALTLLYAVVASTVSWSQHVNDTAPTADDQVAAAYLRDHRRPGDSVVVAFGHADIVEESGLGSPYPYLWALPAFVKDPGLHALDGLLRSARAPRWVVAGGDLSIWGRPGRLVQRTVDHRYVVALRTARWVVWRHVTTARLPAPASTPGQRARLERRSTAWAPSTYRSTPKE